MTDPLNSAPLGTAVVPETTMGLASVPLTGSSTLLLFDASVLNTVTLRDVPAGMVTSRNLGAGGAACATGCDGAELGEVAAGGLDGAAAAGLEGAEAGGVDCWAAGALEGSGARAADVGCASAVAGVVDAACWPPAADCGEFVCEHPATRLAASVNIRTDFISWYLRKETRYAVRVATAMQNRKSKVE